jgi:uncharacterized repeat protein (TIGR04076 family)
MAEEITLFNLRVEVCEVKGRSVCGMKVGDYFEVHDSDRLSLPPGQPFCYWAMQSVMPMLPAKMRQLPANDWLEQAAVVCCPDPEEGLSMKITRTGTVKRKAGLT